MPRRDESGFRHGLRVRVGGATGPIGKLLSCQARDGQGRYWKVRLTSGEWVWPDHLVVDGPGDVLLGPCAECRLAFIGSRGDPICTPCSELQFGTAADRAADANDDMYAKRTRSAYRRRF